MQSQYGTAIAKSTPGSDLQGNRKSFVQPTELSQLASWSSGLVRISSMEVPHSVLRKFADHVLPGFPGDFVRTIAFPPNHILHHSTLHLAIEHVFQIVHVILIIIVRWGWRLNSSGNGAFVIRFQQANRENIVLPSSILFQVQLESPWSDSFNNSPRTSHSVIKLF